MRRNDIGHSPYFNVRVLIFKKVWVATNENVLAMLDRLMAMPKPLAFVRTNLLHRWSVFV
jgi:hypothetical protein